MATEHYPKFYLYKRIVQAKLFIDNNYAENIDLDKISDEAYFSKFHFIRLFKQIYRKTPHQYVTAVRLGKARELLSKGMPVSAVCTSVGFDSLSSFSGKFKSAFGETPSSYLHSQATRQAALLHNPLQFVPACMAARHGWIKNSNFEEASPQ
jgi:AraC-like DNA-binding protein